MPIETVDPKVSLRRVGNALIIVGLVDIAWMIYVISSGYGYSSSFNIFAVIAGVLLRRGSLRTSRVVVFFAAFMFAAFAGLLVALPIIFPADLIQVYLRITPASQLAGWGTFFVVVLGLLWWVYQSLTAAPVEMAIQSAKLGRPRLWHRPKSGFVIGVALVALLSITLPLSNRSESARRAIERARAQFGADHRYFVSSLATSWSSGSGTHVRATVLAYTDSSIESVELEWRE